MEAKGEREARVLLRLSGEISTKARMTRRAFVACLVRNLGDALRGCGETGEVDARYDRLFARVRHRESLDALSRVFGVQSLAGCERTAGAKLEEVVDEGARRFASEVAGRRFAVRARVIGDRRRRPFRGRDLEVALGERLRVHAAGVDLERPEVTVRVEVYEGHAYFLTDERPGPGGLPLGAESHAVALVSGGFDSPVAAWQLLRRGVALDYVFCNLGGATHRLGTLRVAKVLADRWSYGTHPRLHAVDFEPVARDLQERTDARYWQVILKRLMLRAAESVARQGRGAALVTGESVGQVSSQTLQNLAVISDATTLPILRPLVGLNKEEIIAQARHVGTAPLSAVVDEYCALVPRRPATAARLDVVREQESRLDTTLLAGAVAAREVIDLRAFDPDDSGLPPDLEIDHVPEGATVIDLRTRARFATWSWPGSVQLDFPRALEAVPALARDRTYVLVCEFGLKSAHLAELMRRQGLRAHHFRGGTPALRRLGGDGRGGDVP